MANKVTGKTDTSGALSTAPMTDKSVVIVAPISGTQGADVTIAEKELFTITGTADATAVFGNTSVVPKMVKTLISNGVNNIKGIMVPSSGDNALVDTLMATMYDKTIKVVICDNNDEDTITAVKDHLILCESNDMFRYSTFAPSAGATGQAELIAFAKSINDSRIFVAGTELLDGATAVEPQVTASGLAAVIMTETNDPALPMNGVGILGFNGIKRQMLESEMKALANAGVTVFTMENDAPTIYRLVTSKLSKDTNTSDPVWQEGTTRFTADYVLESNMNMLRANYKRTKNVQRVLNGIRSDIKVNMEKMEGAEIIENWDESTLTVVKDPKDAYGALVDYAFDVVTPLYTITITQHMKL